MIDLQNEYAGDAWKTALRLEIITAMTSVDLEERLQANSAVGYYYQCYAPASLYKYYSDETMGFEAVRENKMWYSAPSNFNDIFDCDITMDSEAIFNDTLRLFPDKRGVRAGSPKWKELRANVKQGLGLLRNQFDELRNTIGVSCLSESEDSLLMWAHYANNHRGFCVEYDLLGINEKLKFTAVPIIYSEDRASFSSFNPEDTEKESTRLFFQSLTSKSPEWSYEKEWRIIRDKQACGSNWNVEKKGALLEMICPSSVILGCAAQSEFEVKVKEYCNTNKINLYKMERDSNLYRLNKKPVLMFEEAENSDNE